MATVNTLNRLVTKEQSGLFSKKKVNDQEFILSKPTSHPQNQKA